jgi:CRP/FNR family transcriptional regulator, cyclic AMP receptor protein
MPAEVALLSEVPFFEYLDDGDRATLASLVNVVTFKAGSMIFHAGDPGDSMYILRSGEVEVFFKDTTGHRIVLETCHTGAFFGDISLLDQGPRTASVIATHETEAIRIGRSDLVAFLERKPAAAMNLLAAAGRRIRKSAELLRRTASRNVNVQAEDRRTSVQRTADWIAEFSGSIQFLLLHLLWFGTWIALNTPVSRLLPGAWQDSVARFDPFPFGLLTMVVSLEAIFLSVFVLLSQNRQAAKDRIRGDIEYDVNLKAELEVAHLHEKVDHMQADLAQRLSAIEDSLRTKPRGSGSYRG